MKEKEIRPHKIFNEYLNLAKIDVKNIFKNFQTKKLIVMHVNLDLTYYLKHNFSYHEC